MFREMFMLNEINKFKKFLKNKKYEKEKNVKCFLIGTRGCINPCGGATIRFLIKLICYFGSSRA